MKVRELRDFIQEGRYILSESSDKYPENAKSIIREFVMYFAVKLDNIEDQEID